MDTIPASLSAQTAHNTPGSLLDAGGETWDVIRHLLERRAHATPRESGTILEIVAYHPSISQGLPGWCTDNGHRLLSVQRDGAKTCFGIEINHRRRPEGEGT